MLQRKELIKKKRKKRQQVIVIYNVSSTEWKIGQQKPKLCISIKLPRQPSLIKDDVNCATIIPSKLNVGL